MTDWGTGEKAGKPVLLHIRVDIYSIGTGGQ
jgi:hypothetical protein